MNESFHPVYFTREKKNTQHEHATQSYTLCYGMQQQYTGNILNDRNAEKCFMHCIILCKHGVHSYIIEPTTGFANNAIK